MPLRAHYKQDFRRACVDGHSIFRVLYSIFALFLNLLLPAGPAPVTGIQHPETSCHSDGAADSGTATTTALRVLTKYALASL